MTSFCDDCLVATHLGMPDCICCGCYDDNYSCYLPDMSKSLQEAIKDMEEWKAIAYNLDHRLRSGKQPVGKPVWFDDREHIMRQWTRAEEELAELKRKTNE